MVNPMKIKIQVTSRSKTLAFIFPNLVSDGTVYEKVTELKVLCDNIRSRVVSGQ